MTLAYFSKYWPLLQNMYFSQCTVGFSGVLFAMKASHSAAASSLPGVACIPLHVLLADLALHFKLSAVCSRRLC